MKLLLPKVTKEREPIEAMSGIFEAFTSWAAIEEPVILAHSGIELDKVAPELKAALQSIGSLENDEFKRRAGARVLFLETFEIWVQQNLKSSQR